MFPKVTAHCVHDVYKPEDYEYDEISLPLLGYAVWYNRP